MLDKPQPNHGSYTKLALRGALLNIGTRFGGLVVGLGAMAILARLLQPLDYGIFGIIVLCTAAASVVPDAVSNAVIQHKSADPDELAGAFCLVVACAVTLDLIVFFTLPLLQGLSEGLDLTPYAPLLYVLIPFTAVGVFFDGVQSKLLRFRQVTLVQFLIQNLGQAVLTIILALAGFGAWSLVIGFAAAAVAKVAVQLSMGMTRYVRLRLMPASLRRSTGWLAGVQICNFAGCNGDNIVVAHLLGPVALGLYGRAYNLMNRPANVLGGSVTGVFYPLIASLDSDKRRLREAYLKGLAFAATLAMPAATFASIHSAEIVETMLGSQWLVVIPAFQFLAASLYFRLAYKVTEALAVSQGALKGTMFRQAVYAAGVVGGASAGASFGINGVAAAIMVVLCAFFLFSAVYANRLCETSMWQFALAQAPGIATSAAIATVVVPLRAYLLPVIDGYAVLVIDAAAAALVFGLCLWMRPLWRNSPRGGMVEQMRGRLRRAIGFAG